MGSSYTVTDRDGCRLIDGPLPLSEFVAIADGMPEGAVMDSHAARVLGVGMAIGMPDQLTALCNQQDVVDAAYRRARSLGPGLSDEALKWLAVGRQGDSSQTLFQRLTGVQLVRKESTPMDDSGFGRCRRLLEEVPELAGRLQEAAAISPAWKALVEQWESLCDEMDREAPQWRSGKGQCPETTRRILGIAS